MIRYKLNKHFVIISSDPYNKTTISLFRQLMTGSETKISLIAVCYLLGFK